MRVSEHRRQMQLAAAAAKQDDPGDGREVIRDPDPREPDPIEEPSEGQPIGDPPAAEAPSTDDDDEFDAEVVAPAEAQREPIDSAPQDGRDVLVYYGPEDETGRVVRWKHGRSFNGRRWVPGGHWVPSDDPAPLPAAGPTEWLHFPEAEQAA